MMVLMKRWKMMMNSAVSQALVPFDELSMNTL